MFTSMCVCAGDAWAAKKGEETDWAVKSVGNPRFAGAVWAPKVRICATRRIINNMLFVWEEPTVGPRVIK